MSNSCDNTKHIDMSIGAGSNSISEPDFAVESIFRQAALGIAIRDVKGYYRFSNTSFKDLLQIDTAAGSVEDFKNLSRQCADKLIESHAVVIANGARACLQGQIGYGVQARHLLFNVYPVRDELGNISGTGIVAFDATDILASSDFFEKTLKQVNSIASRLLLETDRLECLATMDFLTGAWNRRWLEEAAKGEISRMRRYRHPVSLIMLDIDSFKLINDQFGHACGDLVLVALVNAVRAVCRDSDSLTRWGGEEFAVLAPNTNRDGAVAIAERIACSIRNWAFPIASEVTVSMGVSELCDSDEFASWVDRADRALYAAKAGGRNRIVIDPWSDSGDRVDEVGNTHVLQFVWNETYCCGHDLIDKQHRTLFKNANNILTLALSDGASNEFMCSVSILIEDVKQHFCDEELILKQAKYPDTLSHCEEHQLILKQVGFLIKALTDNHIKVGELIEYLAHDVIVDHMLGTDRRYLPYLVGQGVIPRLSMLKGA